MPKVSDQTKPYEILVRFHEDGTMKAHYQTRRVVRVDGELLKDHVNDPVSLDLTKEGEAFARKVLGEALTEALIENEKLKNLLAELQS